MFLAGWKGCEVIPAGAQLQPVANEKAIIFRGRVDCLGFLPGVYLVAF